MSSTAEAVAQRARDFIEEEQRRACAYVSRVFGWRKAPTTRREMLSFRRRVRALRPDDDASLTFGFYLQTLAEQLEHERPSVAGAPWRFAPAGYPEHPGFEAGTRPARRSRDGRRAIFSLGGRPALQGVKNTLRALERIVEVHAVGHWRTRSALARLLLLADLGKPLGATTPEMLAKRIARLTA